jgi:hypothetical protein
MEEIGNLRPFGPVTVVLNILARGLTDRDWYPIRECTKEEIALKISLVGS